MNPEFEDYRDCVEKPALVAGANGFVGSQVTRQLVAAGRPTRVLLRKTSNTESIDDLQVERHLGDVSDVDSLKAAMRGCGTVFYSVVDTRAWLSDPAPLYRCNVDGLVNAMDAAIAEGVQRFVFTSSMATIGIAEGFLTWWPWERLTSPSREEPPHDRPGDAGDRR